ncbi:hypothetical protein HOD82_02330 [bacterium]|nr:hypothetical protein [bacterium]
MRLILLIGFMGAVGMIFSFAPYFDAKSLEVNYFVIGLFYLFLFLFLMGMFSLFLFKLKGSSGKDDEIKTNVRVSFRQGFFLSVMVLILLLLQSFRVLVWWDGLLVVGAVLMAESYCLVR